MYLTFSKMINCASTLCFTLYLFNGKCSTIMEAYWKFIFFVIWKHCVYIQAFSSLSWAIIDKCSTSKKYLLRLVDSTSNLVTQCAGHVVLVKNPRTLILKWLIDRVLRRINNISAMQRRRLLVECDQFWKFPCRPTLCRNRVQLSFACQGGCYTWQGAPFNVPSDGHKNYIKIYLHI